MRKGGTIKKYVAARATRILPMFFVGLLVAILCEVAMRGMIRPERWALTEPLDSAGAYWNQLWPSLISLQGVFGTFGSYEPSWTISFEIVYYTVWPLLFYGIGRRRDDRMRLTLVVSYLICLLWMLGGYGLWLMNGRPSESVLLKFWNIPYGMLTWLFGVVLLIFWKPEWDRLARRLFLPVGGLFLLVTFGLAWNGGSQLVNFLKLPLQLLAFGLLLMVNWRPVLSGESLRWLADLSFPLYVMHGSLQMVTGAVCKTYFPRYEHVICFLIGDFSSPILLAGSLGVWLERLFLGWRQRFSSRKQVKLIQRE